MLVHCKNRQFRQSNYVNYLGPQGVLDRSARQGMVYLKVASLLAHF